MVTSGTRLCIYMGREERRKGESLLKKIECIYLYIYRVIFFILIFIIYIKIKREKVEEGGQ